MATSLTLRGVKGTPLTHAELDANFTALRDTADAALPATNPSYTGTLTGGTGVVNFGSGQFYKDASGNVGIGTASPTQRFEVLTSSGAVAARLGVTNNTLDVITDSADGRVELRANPGATTFSKYLAFSTTPSGGSATERLRITSAGDLAIGATSATLYLTTRTVDLRGTDGGTYRFGTATTTGLLSCTGSAIVFGTGAAIPITFLTNSAERLRVDSSGNTLQTQPAPAAVDTTATLTVANLRTRIITSTTAAAVTGTLPTGTLMDSDLFNAVTNMGYDWSVINTGSNTFTVAAGAGHTVVGNMAVAANTSGMFRSRRSAANTWITYRVG